MFSVCVFIYIYIYIYIYILGPVLWGDMFCGLLQRVICLWNA